MAQTIGHNIDRYVGHKLFLEGKRDRKIGRRGQVRQDLRLAAKGR